jgi:hypothetical protein
MKAPAATFAERRKSARKTVTPVRLTPIAATRSPRVWTASANRPHPNEMTESLGSLHPPSVETEQLIERTHA